MSNFQPLEVVGRGSETQLQVVENLNKLRIRVNVFLKKYNINRNTIIDGFRSVIPLLLFREKNVNYSYGEHFNYYSTLHW